MPPVPTFEEEQHQLHAFRVLENREQLIWHANARNESVAQTGLQFEKEFYGLDPTPDRRLYTEATYGDKLPDKLRALILSRGRQAPADQGPSSAHKDGTQGPSSHGRRRQSRPSSGRVHVSASPASAEPQQHAMVDEDAGSVKVEQASPTQLRGRRARSERSSGGSQTASAKKKARKSLTGS